MTQQNYDKAQTGLLFIDPYNDFLSEGGKLWPKVASVAAQVNLLDNLRGILREVRRIGIKVFIVPHRRWEPGHLATWHHPTPYLITSDQAQVFAKDSWGGEWRPDFAPQAGDIVAKEHWGASGFANTDLDFLLKQHRITQVIVVGLLANTCVEGTSRYASELGYHVTLVRDATAAFSADRMHAAHELNGPTFAHAIVSTSELIASLRSADSRAPTAS